MRRWICRSEAEEWFGFPLVKARLARPLSMHGKAVNSLGDDADKVRHVLVAVEIIMPMRCLTVTGMVQASRMASTAAATWRDVPSVRLQNSHSGPDWKDSQR